MKIFKILIGLYAILAISHIVKLFIHDINELNILYLMLDIVMILFFLVIIDHEESMELLAKQQAIMMNQDAINANNDQIIKLLEKREKILEDQVKYLEKELESHVY